MKNKSIISIIIASITICILAVYLADNYTVVSINEFDRLNRIQGGNNFGKINTVTNPHLNKHFKSRHYTQNDNVVSVTSTDMRSNVQIRRFYYPNGNYRNEHINRVKPRMPIGVWKGYHENGNLSSLQFHEEGVKTKVITYTEGGELESTSTYMNGKTSSVTLYRENAVVREETIYNPSESIKLHVKKYHPSGNLFLEFQKDTSGKTINYATHEE